MLATPTGQNIADFKQRYQGVLGWLHSAKPTKLPVYVHNVSSSKVTFRDEEGNEFYANVDSGVEFEFLPTQRAWYNTQRGVFYIQRVPARMWKRGVCSENTSFRELTDSSGPKLAYDDWKTIAFSVMARSLSQEEALARFLNEQVPALALNKTFATSGGRLFFFDLRVGSLDKAKRVFTLDSGFQMVAQELGDVIKRNNLPFTVVNAQ